MLALELLLLGYDSFSLEPVHGIPTSVLFFCSNSVVSAPREQWTGMEMTSCVAPLPEQASLTPLVLPFGITCDVLQ